MRLQSRMFWLLLRCAQGENLDSTPSLPAAPAASVWLPFSSLSESNPAAQRPYVSSPRLKHQRSTAHATFALYERPYHFDRIETPCSFLVFDSASQPQVCH